jgi:carboxypeptidase C (cathepsin A)
MNHLHRPLPFLAFTLAASMICFMPASHAQGDDSGKAAEQHKPGAQQTEAHSGASTAAPNPLPPPSVTSHELSLPGHDLRFKATAGAIRLNDGQSGNPVADLSYVAFELEGGDNAKRPLTFALNGGPGASSAWLDLGGLGPWRFPLDGSTPSTPPVTIDNAETWLDFTDLVFLDPPGTGYSRMLASGDEVRKHFYSVNGDIDALAVAIRKWMVSHNRLDSPKFIVGESYGGFRAPKLARKLQDNEGIGISGLILVSPVLDFSWFETGNNPLTFATHLPSMTATARGLNGVNGRSALADVEAYARGPYIVDLLHGERDAEAQARIIDKVTSFTGIDKALVKRLGGRVDPATFARERGRAEGRVASQYDSLTSGFDPEPHDASSTYSDPVLDAFKTPLASAMADLTANRLNWPIDARYEILNESVNHQWDWSNRHEAQSLSDLKRFLALDPHARVLIVHGLTDEVTPYFTSVLLVDQVPALGNPNRLRLAVLGGGHMVYAKDASRQALHDEARKLVLGE